MDCPEFRDRYSDFRDGLVTAPRELRRFERHLISCAACRRYDVAVQRGLAALRDRETLEPSPAFRRRLDERLERERRAMAEPVAPAHARIAAALLVAAALGLVVLEGAGRMRAPEVAAVPALPPVPFPKPVMQPGVPFVTFQDPRASVVVANPSPYGTALVQPAGAGVEPATVGR